MGKGHVRLRVGIRFRARVAVKGQGKRPAEAMLAAVMALMFAARRRLKTSVAQPQWGA